MNNESAATAAQATQSQVTQAETQKTSADLLMQLQSDLANCCNRAADQGVEFVSIIGALEWIKFVHQIQCHENFVRLDTQAKIAHLIAQRDAQSATKQ